MAKNNLVKMPLSCDPAVIYFRIGGKRYPLRIAQQSDRIRRWLAPVVVIGDRALTREANPSVATAAEFNLSAHDHHVPNDAVPSGLAPDHLPSVEK